MLFGNFKDLNVKNDCNLNENSQSKIGNSYLLPDGINYNSDEAN